MPCRYIRVRRKEAIFVLGLKRKSCRSHNLRGKRSAVLLGADSSENLDFRGLLVIFPPILDIIITSLDHHITPTSSIDHHHVVNKHHARSTLAVSASIIFHHPCSSQLFFFISRIASAHPSSDQTSIAISTLLAANTQISNRTNQAISSASFASVLPHTSPRDRQQGARRNRSVRGSQPGFSLASQVLRQIATCCS